LTPAADHEAPAASLDPEANGHHTLTRVRLFGPLTIETQGRRLGARDLGGVKPKQVFEVLMLARGAQVSKDALGDLLWGDAPPMKVAATLETYVSVLRARVGRSLIVTEHGSYCIRRGSVWTDVDEFDEILSTWKTPQHEALEPLERALMLVRGDLLEDEPYASWAQRARERYREGHSELLRRLALCLLLRGDFGSATTHAHHALDLEPLDEFACRILMVSLFAAGRQQAAFRAYDSCKRLLREELDVAPLDETAGCFAQIRRHEPVDELVADLIGLPTATLQANVS
jgi:DNA-binding SARP family transcriptional activator